MRQQTYFTPLALSLFSALATAGEPVPLFDGESFDGWEGDTGLTWRIVDGVIEGGSMAGNPRNEFLATTERYGDFHLRLEYKLVGSEGFVNGGVQFRSERLEEPAHEMRGYQADIGHGYSGFLYDESRRRRFLAKADPELVARIEKPGEWNRYEVIAKGSRIRIRLNGRETVDYIEREEGIADEGRIALQIHGDCKAVISFRELTIEELADDGVPPRGEILGRFGTGEAGRPELPGFAGGRFELEEGETVVFLGQENFVREQKAGWLESRLAAGFAERQPRFRFMAWEADTVYEQWREANFGAWPEQLAAAGATTVIAQFGQIEALDGTDRLTEFTTAYQVLLDQVAGQTKRIVLVSPRLFERPKASRAPDLSERNEDLRAYAEAIRGIAEQRGAVFIDLIAALEDRPAEERLTDNGIHLNETGLAVVGERLAGALGAEPVGGVDLGALRGAIVRKNRYWFDCWRPANWSFVYGDRVGQRYGTEAAGEPPLKQAFEIQLGHVEEADRVIHAVAAGEAVEPQPPAAAGDDRGPEALTPEEQRAGFTVADGFRVELFASELDGVVNPTHLSWDEQGRLYVACSPSYPQRLASMPARDYVLRLSDTDGDGRADRSERFVTGLTMVQGVEPGRGGVYVCDFDRLLHCTDEDGDGVAEAKRVLFSGFGVGDTHQLINSICHGPDGSLWFSQGLHAMSRVETPHGIARLDRAGLWRLWPDELRLEGFFGGGMAGANCWGIAFDDHGQVFHKSGDRPHGYWSVPGMVRGADPSGSGSEKEANQSYAASPEQYHSVGPLFETSPKTTALEIIGTRALPEELQGCALIAGYFGSLVEVHRFADAGSGFATTQLPRLLTSSHDAFRPVDVSVGPDGAIYVADWYNPVIGHYQASYADPRRDKAHGRIWRISATDRPAVEPPELGSLAVSELIEQLGSPERWVRYQARRLLFEAPRGEVVAAADRWVGENDNEEVLRQLLGIYQAHDAPRPQLLARLLGSADFRVRAYAVRTLGHWGDRLGDGSARLRRMAEDPHPRVRLEAAVAASYLSDPRAIEVVAAVRDRERDPFLDYAIRQSAGALEPRWVSLLRDGELDLSAGSRAFLEELLASGPRVASSGEQLYEKACLACHQPGGAGLPGVYPALVDSAWVRGDPERLIRIVLHGLANPGDGGEASAVLQMPALGGMSDEEVAEVVDYVRAEFGGMDSGVSSEQVGRVRKRFAERTAPWTFPELERD